MMGWFRSVWRNRVKSRLLALGAVLVVFTTCDRGPQPLIESFDGLSNAFVLTARGKEEYWTQPLNDSSWRRSTADDFERTEDPTVGLFYGGEYWALPWSVLRNHHVANLTLAGEPIVVTFCDRCSSASAFVSVADGRRLNFRFAGARNGTILVSDDETGTLWSPFVGEALKGPLFGHRLRRLPLVQCTLAEWMELHPDSWVVVDPSAISGHAHDAYPGKGGFGGMLSQSLAELDDRYPPHEMVLGVEHGELTRGYPLAVLDEAGSVVNGTLGEQEFVIFHKPQSWLAIAYERSVEERTLTFEAEGERIVDRETGSVWSYEGLAKSGPLAGKRLTYLPSGVEEWYIWAIQHPGTELVESL